MTKVLRMIGCLFLTVLFAYGAYDAFTSPITRRAENSFRMPVNVPIVMKEAGSTTLRSLSPFMLYLNDQILESAPTKPNAIGFHQHEQVVSFDQGDILLLSDSLDTVRMTASIEIQYIALRQIVFWFVTFSILSLFFLIILTIDMLIPDPTVTQRSLAEYTLFAIFGWLITLVWISLLNGYYPYGKSPALDYESHPLELLQSEIVYVSEPVAATIWANEDFDLPLAGLTLTEGELGSDIPGIFLDHVVLPRGFIENDTDTTINIRLSEVSRTAWIQWFQSTDRGQMKETITWITVLLAIGFFAGTSIAREIFK